MSNQSAHLKCSPIVRPESSPAVCECATLAKPDNITLSDSIETCYMSELLSIETCYMSELLLMENAKDVGIWRISSMGLY